MKAYTLVLKILFWSIILASCNNTANEPEIEKLLSSQSPQHPNVLASEPAIKEVLGIRDSLFKNLILIESQLVSWDQEMSKIQRSRDSVRQVGIILDALKKEAQQDVREIDSNQLQQAKSYEQKVELAKQKLLLLTSEVSLLSNERRLLQNDEEQKLRIDTEIANLESQIKNTQNKIDEWSSLSQAKKANRFDFNELLTEYLGNKRIEIQSTLLSFDTRERELRQAIVAQAKTREKISKQVDMLTQQITGDSDVNIELFKEQIESKKTKNHATNSGETDTLKAVSQTNAKRPKYRFGTIFLVLTAFGILFLLFLFVLGKRRKTLNQ
jgi:chromosome segregation ATPase